MYSCSDSSEDFAALVGVENCTSEDEHVFPGISSTLAVPKLTGQRTQERMRFPFYPTAAME